MSEAYPRKEICSYSQFNHHNSSRSDAFAVKQTHKGNIRENLLCVLMFSENVAFIFHLMSYELENERHKSCRILCNVRTIMESLKVLCELVNKREGMTFWYVRVLRELGANLERPSLGIL